MQVKMAVAIQILISDNIALSLLILQKKITTLCEPF